MTNSPRSLFIEVINNSMNNSPRSLFIEGVLEETVRSSRRSFETHRFVLGGNEFRLRVLSLRRENRWFLFDYRSLKHSMNNFYHFSAIVV